MRSIPLWVSCLLLSSITACLGESGSAGTEPQSTKDAGTPTKPGPPEAAPQEATAPGGGPTTLTLSATGTGPLTYSITQPPQHGTLETSTLPVVRYTPERHYVGPDSFTFRVTTAANETADATVTLTVVEDPRIPANWWDRAYATRRKLTVNNTAQAEELKDFPIQVKLDVRSFDYSKLSATGQDLRFVSDTGELLSHEVETWAPAGVSILWVRLPSLKASQSTTLWLYYGNPSAPALEPAVARQVWKSGYAGVWHLAGNAKDASPNAFDAEVTKGTFGEARQGRGMQLSAAARDFFRLRNDLKVVAGASAVTFSAWVKPTGAITEKQQNLIGIGKQATGGHASYVSFYIFANHSLGSEAGPDATGFQVGQTPADSVKPDAWTHVASVIDLAGKKMTLFLNGQQIGAPQTFSWQAPAIPDTPSHVTAFGTEEDECCYFYNGALDELRLERVGRSAAWMAAQYKSLADEGFSVVGAEELLP